MSDQPFDPAQARCVRARLSRRAAGRVAVGAGAALLLAACGRKGPPKPPAGQPAPYPRTYPQGATPNPNADSDVDLDDPL